MYPCPFDIQDRHDINAAIITDSEIYAYEEDKLTSVKGEATAKFPERSLLMGLKELKLTPDKIDYWVFPTPSRKMMSDDYFLFFSWIFKAYSGAREDFEKWFEEHVYFVPHQISHASLAIHASPFEECTFVCQDGGGDFGDPRHFVSGDFTNGKINTRTFKVGTNNVCSFHSFLTDSLGFKSSDSGKTSGLAAYGKIQEGLASELRSLFHLNSDGIAFDRRRFQRTNTNPDKTDPTAYSRAKIFSQYPSKTNVLQACRSYLPHDIAATGEHVMSEIFIDLLRRIRSESKLSKAVFSGGLFQNVALNNKILQSNIFEEVFFPMAPSDAGLALGAALHIKNEIIPTLAKRKMALTPYLGPSFKKPEVESVIKSHRLIYEETDCIESKVAQLLANGKVVGWFQGRGEFGPRSLGSRSIVADPRNLESKSKINQLLKKRDWFMPYAPSVLEEYQEEWIGTNQESPYMQVAFQVSDEKAKLVPAAVHVDGSSRVHTVKKSRNQRYWNMIDQFRQITGIPLVLNTSFNRHGIATISTPRQAIEHLMEGCMDYLAIDDFLISFEDNRYSKDYFPQIKPEQECLTETCLNRLKIFDSNEHKDDFEKYLKNLSERFHIPVDAEEGKVKYKDEIYPINHGISRIMQDMQSI